MILGSEQAMCLKETNQTLPTGCLDLALKRLNFTWLDFWILSSIFIYILMCKVKKTKKKHFLCDVTIKYVFASKGTQTIYFKPTQYKNPL